MCRNISLMVGYRIVILLDWEVYGNHMQLSTLCSPITSTTTTSYNFITYVFPPLARSTCNVEKKSLRHVAMGQHQQTAVLQIWPENNEKTDKYDFPVHDCTQEQNGNPYYSPTIRQCKWPSLSRGLLRNRHFATMVTRRHTSLLLRIMIGSENCQHLL